MDLTSYHLSSPLFSDALQRVNNGYGNKHVVWIGNGMGMGINLMEIEVAFQNDVSIPIRLFSILF